jgi:hypothetical protein
MPSLKQLALIGLAATLASGCGGASPDAEVRSKMNEGQVAAARGDEDGRSKAENDLKQATTVDGASSSSLAQAHAVLGQVHYDAGLDFLRDADRKELAASRIALQIAALGAQLGNSATLVQGYQKLDPSAAKTAIEQKIVEAKGGPDKPKWIAGDNINIASLAAADQEISRIQGEIAKRQTEMKDLDTQRVAALEEAEKAMKTSESTKGRESVDAYRQYSDAKKKAADFQARIDQLKGELMPLEKDLDIAVGQQQIAQGAVKEFQDESAALDQGWKDVQSKVSAQMDLIKQIASAADASTQPSETPVAAGKSIAVKATILAQTVKDADDARQKAIEAVTSAIEEFGKASDAANTGGREMSELADRQPGVASVVKIAKEALAPQVYKMHQATAERVLGEMQLTKAAGLSARIKLRDMLTPLMSQAQQPMPKELADATLENQMKEALTAADASFKDASDHLTDVVDGPGSDRIAMMTKKAAILARIFVNYGQQQLALLQANQQAADAAHAKAVEDVKRAATEFQVMFPTLPGDLASAIPPPPAPPPTEATTAPSETATGPSETAGSPDEQAIHATLASFIDALQKGDVDTAKTLAQIEPGQEDTLNQLAGFFSEFRKLTAAAQEKFGVQAAPLNLVFSMAMPKNLKVTVNGDEAAASPQPGLPEEKMFVRVDGQWKVYIGAPSDIEKQRKEAVTKLVAALPTITSNVQNGQYASIQDVFKAIADASGQQPPAATPPAPPAPQ